MRILVLRITKKSAAGNASQESRLQSEAVSIGRGADQDIQLPDMHAALEHAVLKPARGRKFLVTSRFHGGISVNDEVCQHAEVSFGDRITVGNTDIHLRKPPDGTDLVLEVDEVGARETAMAHTTRVNLADAGLRRRSLAWLGFLLVLALAFALPHFSIHQSADTDMRDIAHPALQSWSSGPLSTVHDSLPGDCLSCHGKLFERVQDSACLECHSDLEAHVSAGRQLVGVQEHADVGRSDCTTCHTEHEGVTGIVSMPANQCVDCHGDPERGMTPGRHGSGIHQFAVDHPDFRLLIRDSWRDPGRDPQDAERRLRVEYTDALTERSGLIFPHDVHLDPAGIDGPDGEEVLRCESCHRPDGGGFGMQAISMETDCRRCHELTFDPDMPERTLAHGDTLEVQESLRNLYARIALQGNHAAAGAPDVVRDRRVPGRQLQREQAEIAMAWAERKAAAVSAEVIGARLCNTCHEVNQDSGDWHVQPAVIARSWLQERIFSHADHDEGECGDCHAAASSASAADILIPHVGKCTECHDDRPGKTLLNSGCGDCHGFHGLTEVGLE